MLRAQITLTNVHLQSLQASNTRSALQPYNSKQWQFQANASTPSK